VRIVVSYLVATTAHYTRVVMAYFGQILGRSQAALAAVHSFLEDNAPRMVPLDSILEEEKAENKVPAPISAANYQFPPRVYDSDSDDCMCSNTCSDCVSLPTLVQCRLDKYEMARKKKEVKALARKEKEKEAAARRELQIQGESGRLSREKYNQEECRLFNLPRELHDHILGHLGEPDDLDLIHYSRVSRVFCKVFYDDRVQGGEPVNILKRTGMLIINMTKNETTTRIKALRQAWIELIQRDRWIKMTGPDEGRTPEGVLCGACRAFRDKNAFTEESIQGPLEGRKCRGLEGAARVCEHVVLHYLDNELHANGNSLDSSQDRTITLCDQHGEDSKVSITRQTWSHRRNENEVGALLPIRYNEPYNSSKKGWVVNYKVECAGKRLNDLEFEMVKAVLMDNERLMCPHMRVCDVMTSYSSAEEYLGYKGRSHCKACPEPLCYTRWHFTSSYRDVVTLRVERALSFVEDSADILWLTALDSEVSTPTPPNRAGISSLKVF